MKDRAAGKVAQCRLQVAGCRMQDEDGIFCVKLERRPMSRLKSEDSKQMR